MHSQKRRYYIRPTSSDVESCEFFATDFFVVVVTEERKKNVPQRRKTTAHLENSPEDEIVIQKKYKFSAS